MLASCLIVLNRQEDFILLSRHQNASNGLFAPEVITTGIENELDPSANTFSIIGAIDPSSLLNAEQRYELKLMYKYADGTEDVLRWSQESWITEDSVIGANLSAIEDEYSAEPGQAFRGLSKSSNPNSYLDGSPTHFNWFHAVASVTLHEGGIPGHELKIAYHSELWARTGRFVFRVVS